MSGTPCSPNNFFRNLGIEPGKDTAVVTVDSDFPVGEGVRMVKNAPYVKTATLDTDMPTLADASSQILRHLPTEKGLISCASYPLAVRLAHALRPEFGSRLLTHTSQTRENAIGQHRRLKGITAKELAGLLCVSALTVYKYAAAGRIPSFRVEVLHSYRGEQRNPMWLSTGLGGGCALGGTWGWESVPLPTLYICLSFLFHIIERYIEGRERGGFPPRFFVLAQRGLSQCGTPYGSTREIPRDSAPSG